MSSGPPSCFSQRPRTGLLQGLPPVVSPPCMTTCMPARLRRPSSSTLHPSSSARTGPENDCEVPSRPYLTLLGVHGYSPTGVIGTPSRATPEKVGSFWPPPSTPSTSPLSSCGIPNGLHHPNPHACLWEAPSPPMGVPSGRLAL